MNRKFLSIILVLALAFTTSYLAMAAEGDPIGNTSGSIQFTEGTVIINPPGITEPASPEEYEPGKDLDDDYKYFFSYNEVKDSLYFGSHTTDVYGAFDSKNTAQTSGVGMYTGVEVKNQTIEDVKILVSIGKFFTDVYDEGEGEDVQKENLKGSVLKLEEYKAMVSGLSDSNGFTQNGAQLSNADIKVLTVDSGRSVKAAWSGLLEVLPGTVEFLGKAQAELTWTSMVVETP